MGLYRRPESSIWYIDIRVPNSRRRIRCSARTTDEAAAQRKHDELKARLWKIKADGMRLSDALLAWIEKKPRGKRQLLNIKQIRAQYPDRPLTQVTEASIEEVWGKRAPGTYNKLAGILRSALNIAYGKGWIDHPPQIKRRKEPDVEPRALTAAEWKALRAELADHQLALMDFAIATGQRWSNVAKLEWERVDLKHKQAWIPASTTKAGKTIPIPLSPAAIRALKATGANRKGYVFTYKGKPIGSPKTSFNKAKRRAGLSWVTPHCLRHTWASWHAMNGTPLEVLQVLGAWQTRDMVQRYAHLAPSYVAQFAGNAKPTKASKRAA